VDRAAPKQVRQPSVHFGTTAEARPRCAGTVRGVVGHEPTGHGRAATPEPLRARRENTRAKVSVAGACALRLLLAEPGSATLRVPQAAGRCRTGRVRPVRVAVARSGQQNQDMPLSTTHRALAGSVPVFTGNRAPVERRKAAPNWALEPTRSGRPRLAAPGSRWPVSFRGQPRPASTVGSAQR
jgi:hypothetical protein